MTKETAILILENISIFQSPDSNYRKALDMAINALKNQPKFIIHSDGTIQQIIEPCEDCISRKAAIDKMQELEDEDDEMYGCSISEGFDGKRAIEALKALPSIQPQSKTVNKYCDAEKLNYIREYIVNNIMRESDIMNNEDCRNVVDLPEVIASLYELLHLIVTGEPYEYMFHWANKCGSWVENDLFTEQYDRRCEK